MVNCLEKGIFGPTGPTEIVQPSTICFQDVL